MAVDIQNYAKLLEPGLRKVFFDTYTEKAEQYSRIFKVNSSKKRTETDYHIGDLGIWDAFNGSVNYEDLGGTQTVTFTHTEFAKGIQIKRSSAEDDLYGIISGEGGKKTRALAQGAKRRVEVDSANILNNAFTSNGYDGVSLFSASHPLLGNAGGTQGNLASGALTDANLKSALILMRKQVDESGDKIEAMADRLIVPPDLEYTAITLTQSSQTAGTANNDINAIRGKLGVVVNDYLSSSTAWFLQDSSFENLIFFWRVKPQFFAEDDNDHFLLKYTGRMRFSVGYSDYRGLVGSTGV